MNKKTIYLKKLQKQKHPLAFNRVMEKGFHHLIFLNNQVFDYILSISCRSRRKLGITNLSYSVHDYFVR